MTPYAIEPPIRFRYQYRLAAVISHLGALEECLGRYIAFVRIFDQWIRFNDSNVDFVHEAAAFKENFLESVRSTQTATIRLDVADY
jgi:ubiquitin C-terminal hydrolase